MDDYDIIYDNASDLQGLIEGNAEVRYRKIWSDPDEFRDEFDFYKSLPLIRVIRDRYNAGDKIHRMSSSSSKSLTR